MGPVAVTGIACRLPGDADGPDELWQLLRAGVDAVSDLPPDRRAAGTFYGIGADEPGTKRWGGYLRSVDRFDAAFFKISPKEAIRVDPQQRLLLELAWEALEDAGIAADRLAGTRAGVYVGISASEYGSLQARRAGKLDPHAMTGSARSIAANRLSYFFDLQGPSLALDTACSSSLVAVHLACQSLALEECDLALVGGTNLILSPLISSAVTSFGAMSSDGRCKTFDAAADGCVRGEGAAVVVLRPLARALADQDRIYAVIRGSAVNQDGRTNGITAPSQRAQEKVLAEAYRRANVAPSEVSYVEAHGTGTLLGDPIEAKALGAVLAEGRAAERPCAIGSIKTNLAHLEAAAGLAGLIKVCLALHRGALLPSLHFRKPNPYIPFAELKLSVQTSVTEWPSGHRLAGVSAFGFGGTNAHVVLEQAPRSPSPSPLRSRRQSLLPLSARSPAALAALAKGHLDALRAAAADAPAAADALAAADAPAARTGAAASTGRAADRWQRLCSTAANRRVHHDHRAALAAGSAEEALPLLEPLAQGRASPQVSSGRRVPGARTPVVFVFSGHGSQWAGMGRSLAEEEPVFRGALERFDRILRARADLPVLELLSRPKGPWLEQPELVQPLLFALQCALAELWRSWGIEPAAVVGHSLGEVAAACVAGALTPEDAAAVVCARSPFQHIGILSLEFHVDKLSRPLL